MFDRFLAGQLACMRDLTLFLAPNINSYKRFAEGSFAPTAVAWGRDNRTCSMRVIGHGPSLRMESRVAGGDVNPYLAIAAMIASGLHGVDNELELEPVFEGNAYTSDKPHVPSTLAGGARPVRRQRRRARGVRRGRRRALPQQPGQLACMRDLTLFLAPNINSYKRYAEGSFAPTAVAWGRDNRTCSMRVIGHGPSLRMESRVAGGDVNPYLAIAAMIASGLHGIENELELEPVFEGNAYTSDKPHVPSTLQQARDLFGASDVAKAAFGEDVVAHYLNNADVELRAFGSRRHGLGAHRGASSDCDLALAAPRLLWPPPYRPGAAWPTLQVWRRRRSSPSRRGCCVTITRSSRRRWRCRPPTCSTRR